MVVLLVHARVAGWARDGERQGRHGTLELDGAMGRGGQSNFIWVALQRS